MVANWIHLWLCILLVDQREIMDIGYNRLLMVAHDFFFQATGWRHINNFKWIAFFAFHFLLVDSCVDP
jgi:two-component response regulator (ARR-B family)